MINVSNEFRETMKERTDFKEYAEIIFSDGSVLELEGKDFTISNNYVVDGAGESSVPLGAAVERCIQIELVNDEDQYSEYDFFGAKIRLYLTFELSETTERIEKGTFTVLNPETYGTTVLISAVDNMYKADKDYSTNLTFPATLGAVLRDSCSTTGILLESSSFSNDNFVVETMPTGLTHRELIGYVAMIAGGNARINRSGNLEILSYNFEDMIQIIDGGDYKDYDLEDTYDGGDFTTYDLETALDGGTFTDRDDIHVLWKWKNIKVDTDDIVITGIQTTYNDGANDVEILEGDTGYVIDITNPLILGKEADALKLIGAQMIGGTFRKFEGDHVSNPLVEFMDLVIVLDRKGNAYTSFVTDVNFVFFGYTTIKNSAESALRNSSKFYSASAKTYQASRKLVEKEKTEREKAIEVLNKTLQEASGLFETEGQQEDGSTIYYLHDKPTLGESQNVIKLTAEAIGFSNNGGETYPYGFTLTGEMITRVLQTEGINADWINTGAFSVKDADGNVIFSADMTTKNVTFINGWFDSDGAHFEDGEFSGTVKSSRVTGSRIETESEDGTQEIVMEGGRLSFGIVGSSTSPIAVAGYIYPYLTTAPVGNYEYDFKAIAFKAGTRSVLEFYTETDKVMQAIPTYGDVAARVYFPQYATVEKSLEVKQEITGYSDLIIDGDFMCYGTKDRVVRTENYGLRSLYCYEMPTPMFGDIGTAVINEDGFCTIAIDDIFLETIDCNIEYHVFLQKEGPGDLWVSEKEFTYFTVSGTPGLAFSWEMKAVQKDYETYRLEDIELRDVVENEEEELLKIGEQELAEYDAELEELS